MKLKKFYFYYDVFYFLFVKSLFLEIMLTSSTFLEIYDTKIDTVSSVGEDEAVKSRVLLSIYKIIEKKYYIII